MNYYFKDTFIFYIQEENDSFYFAFILIALTIMYSFIFRRYIRQYQYSSQIYKTLQMMNLEQRKETQRQNLEPTLKLISGISHSQSTAYKAKKAGKDSMPHHFQSPFKEDFSISPNIPQQGQKPIIIPHPGTIIGNQKSTTEKDLHEKKPLIKTPQNESVVNCSNQQLNLDQTKKAQMNTINQESESQYEEENQVNQSSLSLHNFNYKFQTIDIPIKQIISPKCLIAIMGQSQQQFPLQDVKCQIKQFFKIYKIRQFPIRQKKIHEYLTCQLIRFYQNNQYVGEYLQLFKLYVKLYVFPHIPHRKSQNSLQKKQIKLQWQQKMTFFTIHINQDMNFLKNEYFIYVKNIFRILSNAIKYKQNQQQFQSFKNPDFINSFLENLFSCMRSNYNMMKISKSSTYLSQILQQILYYGIVMWPLYFKEFKKLKELIALQISIASLYHKNQKSNCPYFQAIFLQIFLIQPFNMRLWDKNFKQIFYNHSEELVFQLLHKLYQQNMNSMIVYQKYKKFQPLITVQWRPYFQNFIYSIMNNNQFFLKDIYKIEFVTKSIINILNQQNTLNRDQYPEANKFIASLANSISSNTTSTQDKMSHIHKLSLLLAAWCFPKYSETSIPNEKSIGCAFQNEPLKSQQEYIFENMLNFFNSYILKLEDQTISDQHVEIFMSISSFFLNIQTYAPGYLLKNHKNIFFDFFQSEQSYYNQLIFSNFMAQDLKSNQLHSNNSLAINLVTSLLKNLSKTKIALDIIGFFSDDLKQESKRYLMVNSLQRSKEMSKSMINNVLELFIQQFPLLRGNWYEQNLYFFLEIGTDQNRFFIHSGYFLNELLKRIENGSCSIDTLSKITKAPAFLDTPKILLQFFKSYNHQTFRFKQFEASKQKDQILNKYELSFELIMRISQLFILHKKCSPGFINFPSKWINFMNFIYSQTSNQGISPQEYCSHASKILNICIQILLGFDNIKILVKRNRFVTIRHNILQTIINFIKMHHIYHLNIDIFGDQLPQTLNNQDLKTRFTVNLKLNPCIRARHILAISPLVNHQQRRKTIYSFFNYSFQSLPSQVIIEISEYALIFYSDIVLVHYPTSKFKHFSIVHKLFQKLKIQKNLLNHSLHINKNMVQKQCLQNIHKFFTVIRNTDIQLFKDLINVHFSYYFDVLNVQILQDPLQNKQIITFGKPYYQSIIYFLDAMKECSQSDMPNKNLKDQISKQFLTFLIYLKTLKRENTIGLDKVWHTDIFSRMICFTVNFFKNQTFRNNIMNNLMQLIGQNGKLNDQFKQLSSLDKNLYVQMLINNYYGDKISAKMINEVYNIHIYAQQNQIAQNSLQSLRYSSNQNQSCVISKMIYLWRYAQFRQVDLSIFTKKRYLRDLFERFILQEESHLVIWVIEIIVQLVTNEKIKQYSYYAQRIELINMIYKREKYFERLTYLMKKLSWSHGNKRAFDNTYFQYLTNAKPGIISILEKTQLIAHLKLFVVIKSLQWEPDFFESINFKQTTKRIIKNSEYFFSIFSRCKQLQASSIFEAKLKRKRVRFISVAKNQLQIYNYLLTCKFIETMTLIIPNIIQFQWKEEDFNLVLNILKQLRKKIQLLRLMEKSDSDENQEYEKHKKARKYQLQKNKLNLKNQQRRQQQKKSQNMKKSEDKKLISRVDPIRTNKNALKDKITWPRQRQNRFNQFGNNVYNKSEQFAKYISFLNSSSLISRIPTSFSEVKDRLVENYFLLRKLCSNLSRMYFKSHKKQHVYYSIVMKQLQRYEILKAKI